MMARGQWNKASLGVSFGGLNPHLAVVWLWDLGLGLNFYTLRSLIYEMERITPYLQEHCGDSVK